MFRIVFYVYFRINWLREVGLLNHWERAYWPRKNRCSEPLINSRPKHISTKLTLDALSSAFLLLACGLLLSFLVFLIEKYLFYRSINRNNWWINCQPKNYVETGNFFKSIFLLCLICTQSYQFIDLIILRTIYNQHAVWTRHLSIKNQYIMTIYLNSNWNIWIRSIKTLI